MGLLFLNHDLQQRITRSSLNGVKVARAHATMDIESIFALRAKQKNENVPENEKYNINVLVQGYMHLSASYMRCKSMPLLICCDPLYIKPLQS